MICCTKILTAAAGGNIAGSDLGASEYVGEFYNMGIVEDLTERYESWDDKSTVRGSYECG